MLINLFKNSPKGYEDRYKLPKIDLLTYYTNYYCNKEGKIEFVAIRFMIAKYVIRLRSSINFNSDVKKIRHYISILPESMNYAEEYAKDEFLDQFNSDSRILMSEILFGCYKMEIEQECEQLIKELRTA